jgi:hypothetical protein
MSDKEIKLLCLEIAASLGDRTAAQILADAKKLWDFCCNASE